METIKVIDLLIRLSNDDIPKRIIWSDELWVWNDTKNNYYTKGRKPNIFAYMGLPECLNDEVGIILEGK